MVSSRYLCLLKCFISVLVNLQKKPCFEKQLVREFKEHDLRTYRLCFAIKMQPKIESSSLANTYYDEPEENNSKVITYIVYRAKIA